MNKVNQQLREDLIRSELRKLPEDMKTAIILRFWQNETIEEISQQIKKSWDETNDLIIKGLEIIKQGPLAYYVTDTKEGA